MPAEKSARSSAETKHILVIDVGGTNVKVLATGEKQARQIPSGPKMTPRRMVAEVKKTTSDWKFDRISIGYPGPVVHGHPLHDPFNLGPGWVGFDFRRALGRPVKILNDAAMQALGSYRGGRMLFLGLGTGLGSAMIADGVIEPMELAHLQYRHGKTYEDYLGLRGLKRAGKKKWRRQVAKIIESLQGALEPDYIVIGGGNAKKLKALPRGCRLGANSNAFLGGFQMWQEPASRSSAEAPVAPKRAADAN